MNQGRKYIWILAPLNRPGTVLSENKYKQILRPVSSIPIAVLAGMKKVPVGRVGAQKPIDSLQT
jgi:hypothetical protein